MEWFCMVMCNVVEMKPHCLTDHVVVLGDITVLAVEMHICCDPSLEPSQ